MLAGLTASDQQAPLQRAWQTEHSVYDSVNQAFDPDTQPLSVLQGNAVPFSDSTSVYEAELWDPATEAFTLLAAAAKPRNYHSVAVRGRFLLLRMAHRLSVGQSSSQGLEWQACRVRQQRAVITCTMHARCYPPLLVALSQSQVTKWYKCFGRSGCDA